MNPVLQSQLAQAELESKEREDSFRRAYDTLYGYLCSVGDPYSRAKLVHYLDELYEGSLQSIPDFPLQRAETVDVKTTFPKKPEDASTASSGTPSAKSSVKSSRDLSYPSDEDVATR